MNNYEVMTSNVWNTGEPGHIGKFIYINSCQKRRVAEQSYCKYFFKDVENRSEN